MLVTGNEPIGGRPSVRRGRVLVLLAACVVLAGCGWKAAKEDAEKAVAAHFQAVRAQDYESVLAGYDDRFYTRTPRAQWTEQLRSVTAKLGPFRSYEILGWNVNQRAGTDAGTFVEVRLRVSYEKSATKEELTLFRSSSSQPMKILGHHIGLSTGPT